MSDSVEISDFSSASKSQGPTAPPDVVPPPEEESTDNANANEESQGESGESEVTQSACLVCLNFQPASEQEEGQKFCTDGVGDGDANVDKDLVAIYVLRKVLRFPKKECVKLLTSSTVGVPPGNWCVLCESCFRVVAKAVRIRQQIVEVEKKLGELMGLLKEEGRYDLEEVVKLEDGDEEEDRRGL